MIALARQVVIFIITVVLVTIAIDRAVPESSPGDSRRVDAWNEVLESQQPRVVLLGNSLLGHGVNEIQFSIRTGINTIKVWGGGLQSAWQFLAIKNLLANRRVKPETIVVFFRDGELTDPTYRVGGEYKLQIDALRDGTEPALDRLAYHEHRHPLANFISDTWSLDRHRETVKPFVEDRTKSLVGSILRLDTAQAVDDAIGRVFADANLNAELFSQAQFAADVGPPNQEGFRGQLESSFLPLQVEIAREAGIELIFVRMKKLRYALYQERGEDGQSSDLRSYNAELSAYFESRGLLYLDYTDDPRITTDLYGVGDHLNADGRFHFTQVLAEDLAQALGPPDAVPPYSELADFPEELPPGTEFVHGAGFNWSTSLPDSYDLISDMVRDSKRSIIMIYEDGKPLGPGNSNHSEIRTLGAGRFSHWSGRILFSTSDNSDPNTNGRVYTARLMLPE